MLPQKVAAQAVTVGPLAATPSIPVDAPWALAIASVGVCAGVAWLARKGLIASALLRSCVLAVMGLGLGGVAIFGSAVQAQLAAVQRDFTQPAGETQAIPVQATGMAPDGSPLGFVPVEYTNRAGRPLGVIRITQPTWNTCFPLGIPTPLPTTPASPGAACTVGSTLGPNGVCRVDVAQLCAAAAATVLGHQPSSLVADTDNVAPGGSVSGNVLSNDADADAPLLVASYVAHGSTVLAGTTTDVPGWGRLVIHASGAYTFAAAAPYGSTSPTVITYRTHTGATSTLTIAVQAHNRAPVAQNDTVAVPSGGSAVVSVRGNDTDPDGDALTVTAVTQGGGVVPW